jgi:hypothetical protein
VRPLRTYAVLAAVVLVVGALENALFGRDTPGTAHDVSILFFFAAVLALAVLVVLAVLALVRRLRTA